MGISPELFRVQFGWVARNISKRHISCRKHTEVFCDNIHRDEGRYLVVYYGVFGKHESCVSQQLVVAAAAAVCRGGQERSRASTACQRVLIYAIDY